MRPLLLAFLLAAPARAGLFGRSHDYLKAPKELFAAGRHEAVVEALSPDTLQKLSSADLSWAYLHLGASLEALGRTEQAMSVYQLGVRLFPKDLNLLTRLGNLLHHAGLEEQAEPFYARVLAVHPRNGAAHVGLAEIDRALGLTESSAEHYEKALDELGNRADLWREYAETLAAQRDYATAELAATRAVALAEEPDSLVDLARIQRASGRLDKALETIARAAALDPSRPELGMARALWLLEAGRLDAAGAAAEARLREDAGDPLAHWIRARVNLKADRYNAAVADLAAAAKAEKRAPFAARAAAALLAELQGKK